MFEFLKRKKNQIDENPVIDLFIEGIGHDGALTKIISYPLGVHADSQYAQNAILIAGHTVLTLGKTKGYLNGNEVELKPGNYVKLHC